VNLPNYITLSRIASVPLLIWLLCTTRFNNIDGEQEILASALFIAAMTFWVWQSQRSSAD